MYYKWNRPRAFPLEILHFIKKKHKIASPEKSTSSDEKELNFLSFYARIKTKTVLEFLKDFLQNVRNIFFIFFFFSIDLRF